MYDLSQSKFLHKRDLRCLDYHAGTLVTGGSDNLFTMHALHAGALEHITSQDFFTKNILSVRINRRGG